MKQDNRAVRDPIHGYIRLNEAENALIDSPFIQRLRWVSQLSGVKLVFPGGTHNRLAHIMGVMHLSGSYAESVYDDLSTEELKYNRQLARLAGLLHDVAHGAFSHAYDDTVYKLVYPGNPHGHDTHRYKLIQSEYLKPLIEACGVEPQAIIDLWKGEDPVAQATVQGALGADRMDFMLRDSYFAGTSHFGTVASSRIISNSIIAEHNGKRSLHYRTKVLDDIFQALLGRFYMYRGVYFHKASSAADILIKRMLSAAAEPLNLAERTTNLEEFQFINEYTLIGEIMSRNDKEIHKAKDYCTRLLQRDLPKLVWETIVPEKVVKTISSDLERGSKLIAHEQFIDKIKAISEKNGHETPEFYIFNTYPMSTIDHDEFNAGNIYIWDKRERLVPGKRSLTFSEAIQSTSYFKSFLSNVEDRQRYVMIRVYTDRKDAAWIRKHEFQNQSKIEPDISQTSY